MPEYLSITHDLALPLSEITIRTSRSSGPGGQHANVTASRVEVIFDVATSTALTEGQRARITARLGPRPTAIAQDTRSQTRNRELALERLRQRLSGALAVSRVRRPTRPSAGARERRLSAKRHGAERKQARRRPGLGED